MLSRLHIENYVLIDSLEIDFPEGLVIITGQTGAGKSILLGALSLLLGGKADASMISPRAERCTVEALFEVDPGDEVLKRLFEENDLDWSEGEIIIRRNIASSGRSRSFVNDSPVNVGLLCSLGAKLIDIHSQHQTMMLTDGRFQLGLLDRFAGNEGLLSECSKAFASLGSLKASLAEVNALIAKARRDEEYNKAQFQQLSSAHLVLGELEELELEQKSLANSEQIKEMLSECETLAAPDPEISLTSSLKEIGRNLERLSAFIPSVLSLSERIDSARIEVEDILCSVSQLSDTIDVSPERLQTVDDRLALLYSLQRKFDCSTLSELIALRNSLEKLLFDNSELLEKKFALEGQIAAAQEALQDLAVQLHNARLSAAEAFSRQIEESIRGLEMPLARFSVALEDCPMSENGCDSVRFLFSATSGQPLAEVSKCASGGELSRIMLCLKNMMCTLGNMPTMIFDEIDTGVSGSVADKMGSMICSMGSRMQVFAITHLPQVAAKGQAHYLVTKETTPEGKTISHISKLSSEERVLEVARMLSGSTLSEAAIANAKELLKLS